jgi:radical SAM superfamily enzyme YgiQ (UPF0313 family)
MIRADELLKHIDEWKDQRFATGLVGIESLSQTTLDGVGKRESTESIRTLIRKLQQYKKYSIGYYMIGYESDTEESIRRDLAELCSLHVDFNQLCVVTPLPRTPLWDEIESKYGIFEKDWHRWDAKHLVWNHPHLSPDKVDELFLWGVKKLNRPPQYFRSLTRWTNLYLQSEGGGVLSCLEYLVRMPVHAFRFDVEDRDHRLFLHGPVSGRH